MFNMCLACVSPHQLSSVQQNIQITIRNTSLLFTNMSNKRPTKRRKGPLKVGDIELAKVVTPKTIYETKKDGTVVSKKVWISLDTPTPKIPTVEESSGLDYGPIDEPFDVSPPPERTHASQVSNYFIEKFGLSETPTDAKNAKKLPTAVCRPRGRVFESSDIKGGNAGRYEYLPAL